MRQFAAALSLAEECVSEGKGEGHIRCPSCLGAQGLVGTILLGADLGLEAAGGAIDAVGPAASIDRGGQGGQIVAGWRRRDSGRGKNLLCLQ